MKAMPLSLRDRIASVIRVAPAAPGRRQFFRRSAAGLLVPGLAIPGLLFPKAALALTTDNIAYGTYVAMTVTNLQSLANDATDVFAGWQSARVSNLSTLADDYAVSVRLTTANTSPGNELAAYVYVVPWMTTDGGSTWNPGANFGTTTLPSGSEGTANISEPNSMKGPFALPYKIAQQVLSGWFTISQMCGGIVPDGWSLAIRNSTGAALSTGCVVEYRPITYTNS